MTLTCRMWFRPSTRSRVISRWASWSSWSRRPTPGRSEEVVRPKLEAGGLKAGRDFYLAFSPERVDPGNTQWKTRNIRRWLGG